VRRAGTACLLAAAAVLAAGCGSSDAGTAASSAATPAPKPNATVVMKGLKFTPRRVTIHKGQTIEWVDKDLVDHSVTAKGFNSPDFAQGETWSHTFARAGVIRYHDHLNPSMKGIVVVKR
jgi:plastocyanin